MSAVIADIRIALGNSSFVRIGDLGGWRSERPQSALPVEICEAQHLSSWVFLRSLRLAPMSALAPNLPPPAKK
jgi:hypothetical protein